jgi:hypothetical protein
VGGLEATAEEDPREERDRDPEPERLRRDHRRAARRPGIPTLILFACGRELDWRVGAAPKAALRQWLQARAA